MKSKWKCPFCGQPGDQTQEHVWPKWLRKSPATQELVSQAHGERGPYRYVDLKLEGDRLIEVPRTVNVHQWVPNITTTVCARCNNGWMSRLESEVRRSIGPNVLNGELVTIEALAVKNLARWAVKTAMAYLMALQMRQGVFTPQELRGMAHAQQIPDRCCVWLRSMAGVQQFIACQYRGLYLADGADARSLSLRDNVGIFQIGLPGLALFVSLAPDPDAQWLIDSLLPIEFGTAQTPRIWPDAGRLRLPTANATNEIDPEAVFAGLEAMREIGGTSLADLDPSELSKVLQSRSTTNDVLGALVDRLAAGCRDANLDPSVLDGIAVLSTPSSLSVAQWQDLLESAMTLFATHGESRPADVSRYLFNLGHLMASNGSHIASLMLLLLAVGNAEGGYSGRPDAWAQVGHSAWHVNAFHAAGDAYEQQVRLTPDDMLAVFNMAEARFWEGDLPSAAAALAGINLDDDASEVLLDNTLLLTTILELVSANGDLPLLTGFTGQDPLAVLAALATDDFDIDKDRRLFTEAILELLPQQTAQNSARSCAARAYLTDAFEVWLEAVVHLLVEFPESPLLMPVLRKANSKNEEFPSLLKERLEAVTDTSSPAIRRAVRYAYEHAYARYNTTRRLVDEANHVLDTL